MTFHATTIVAVKKGNKVAIAGDGQVTFTPASPASGQVGCTTLFVAALRASPRSTRSRSSMGRRWGNSASSGNSVRFGMWEPVSDMLW